MSGTGRRVIGASARLPGTAGHEESQDGAWQRLRAGRTDAAWRLSVTAVVAALVAVTGIVFAVLQAQPSPPRAAPAAAPAGDTSSPAARANAAPSPSPAGADAPQGISIPQSGALVHAAAAYTVPPARTAPSATAPPAQKAAAPLTLTAADHQDCPAKATACVDLTRHITWLQAGGKTTFGPVAMEPGKPTGKHQTRRGTFHVSWKAGPTYMSTTYNEPMPWATFFTSDGIAFHGGPLNQWSHGCVHLTNGNAHYYNAHLPIGAEVVVF
jgi:lipoprotein-anchoring transpeptidase ErfK/SrfK